MSPSPMRLVSALTLDARPSRPTAPPTLAPTAPRRPLPTRSARGCGERPRRLPPHALYDALGSALFDAICHLPWYPITRAETALLRTHRRSILEAAGRRPRVVELGPGNGEKLATLMQGGAPDAGLRRPSGRRLGDRARCRVGAGCAACPASRCTRTWRATKSVCATSPPSRDAGETLLVAFLGSNIGNFDPPEAAALLTTSARAMQRGDTLLIGADLVKPVEQLQAAYDDPLGVTAAFNCNLLVRLNRELDADFDLEHFAHDARWNPRAQRMEMHLVSLAQQRVHIPGAGLVIDFHAGETIWTESSYKYEPAGVRRHAVAGRVLAVASWQDEDAGFLLTLAAARRQATESQGCKHAQDSRREEAVRRARSS